MSYDVKYEISPPRNGRKASPGAGAVGVLVIPYDKIGRA